MIITIIITKIIMTIIIIIIIKTITIKYDNNHNIIRQLSVLLLLSSLLGAQLPRNGDDHNGFCADRSAASMPTAIVQHVHQTTRTSGNKKAVVFSPKRHRCIVRKYYNE